MLFHTLDINQFQEKFTMNYSYFDSSSSKYLICVHGITRNCRDFDYLATVLSKHYKIICPDIVGRGKSSWLQNYKLYNYSTYCKSIIYLLKHLKITQIDFLGTSMGGIIGMYLSAYFPNLINKLIINDIGPFINIDSLKKIDKNININPIFNTINEVELYIKKLLYSFGITQEQHWQHIIKHSIVQNSDNTYALAVDPKIGIAFSEEISNIDNMDMWNIWNKIHSKILVIRGAVSNILTRSILNQMVLSKPDMSFIEYQNAGHAPALMENYQIHDIQNWLLT
ncbi:alpha/beta fold hydrolase [Ehrlichia ruminantium]|uniref:alpha/beta fold hydrolase n=1 Tax=Ehrlichia ruminantium TaxID=779 RepID=UPI0015DC39D1|nr:alpha/beta fold hydrolase [Ehrlichia ruminantium]QLK58176.1 alpha/beta fold hydrolase [Ehrlichia ruminantium]UOD97742.1 alpha/beta fold hydrolase [Ehrlichia ruminantium]